MNKENTKYIKLIRLLVNNNKLLFLFSVIASVIGFTFLFTITSLSETIVRTRQETTIHTYGRFLMVMSDIDNGLIIEVKKQNNQFEFESFDVEGNIEYSDKKITLGSMEEQMGDTLGFHLLYGNWPENSNQIAIEEYLTYLFDIQDEKLPITVSLIKDRQTVNYEITAIISNYSYALSASSDSTLDTNVYPSIIFEKDQLKHAKTSLVILQKKLDFKSSIDDINTILKNCYEVNLNIQNISFNERLYSEGYKENSDIVQTKEIYLVLLNILLILEQIVMMKVILTRNKKTLFLFEALGLSPKQKRKIILYMTVLFALFGLVMGGVITTLLGLIYMDKTFLGYSNFYYIALIYNITKECIIIGVIMLCLYFGYGRKQKESIMRGMIEEPIKEKKKYKFKKIDLYVVFMQTICLFFTIASMNFINMFQLEQGEMNYDLYSKRTIVAYPLKEYSIAEYEENFFSYDSMELFKEYDNDINLSMEAETKLSSILIKEDCLDEYFSDYYKDDETKLSKEDEKLWNQISEEDKKYKPISPYYVKITVLPQKEFNQFLEKENIENYALENNEEKSCVLVLPDYKQLDSNSSQKKQVSIQLGRIQKDGKQIELIKEEFKVEELISPDTTESSQIQIVMSETVAKKSDLVIGYNKIRIVMSPIAPESVQKEIEQKISLLMASIQGGMLDSSVSRNQEDKLMDDYTSMMSTSILFFCMGVICIYVILNSYIDWEKKKYEYGILRSFGMSYSALQHKLFLRYSNSILVASIISVVIGNKSFPNGMVTIRQIIISLALITLIMYLCRGMVYYWNRNKSISSMLNEG